MPSMWIVKTGDTLPSLREERGDFEDWITAGLGIPPERVHVVDVVRGESLPNPALLGGVVITGSHSMVTERQPWSDRTALWLRNATIAGTPILGICYGHQLLAYALDGIVGNNPYGGEYGTLPVTLSEAGRADPLLGGMGVELRVHFSHTQSVLRLPPGATALASSERDPNEAFIYGKNAWGVQFHPEFDAGIVRAYTEAHRSDLLAAGQDPDKILASIVDTPVGTEILRRFVRAAGLEA